MGNPNNIKIVSVDATWEIEEKWDVTCVADVASSLNNKYFFIYAGDGNSTKYHVWYNVGAAGVDPAPVGSTAIDVAISANATASAVATATQVAVDAETDFEATVSGAVVTIVCAAAATTTDFADVDSGFTFAQVQDGGSVDLGLLDGNVELSLEEQLYTVNAHQNGLTTIGLLRQGVTGTVTMVVKEDSSTVYSEIFKATAGDAFTPSGGTTEVYGWGDNRLGDNALIQSRRLILHPTARLAADYAGDVCFFKAYPKPSSITFSGEEPKMMSLEFECFPDDSKDSRGNFVVCGDWTPMVP